MVRALHVALVRARDDTQVRAVTLIGTGDAFSAGADLKEFISGRRPLEQALERRELGGLFLLIDAYPKPLVAAVNGDALGAGFGLVAACPLAVAAQTARFGLPGVRLGIMPMTIMPAIFRSLPRKLGLELILTGRLMAAAEAASVGFINATVAAADLESAALQLATSSGAGGGAGLGSNRPLTIQV
jgi:enoyl-CoA hydratase/carnithine racemase